MKKSLKEELVSLAHNILQLKEGSSYEQLTQEARAVYEKLMVLAYAEKLENAGLPTIGLTQVEAALEQLEKEPFIPEKEVNLPKEEPAADEHRPDGTLFNEEEPVHEPVIEKIKDMVAEMPPEAAAIDKLIDSIEPKHFQKNDILDIGGEYAETPIFEPVATQEQEQPKNLNDRLKSGLKIGLNDKIAFIKHLFEGSDADYLRVLSQLETFSKVEDATHFINEMVKPDYKNWEGKEEYEERFMQVVANKFE